MVFHTDILNKRPIFSRLFEMHNAPPALWTLALSGLSTCYQVGAQCRRGLYEKGLFRAKRLPMPVVSVGNLSVGAPARLP